MSRPDDQLSPAACGIREARHHDHAEVCAVLAEVESLHREAHPALFPMAHPSGVSIESFVSLLQKTDAAVLVAEQGRGVVGFVIARLMGPGGSRRVPPVSAEVQMLAVREAHRSLGIGRALMRRAEEWARQQGARAMELNVWEFNASAMTFYQRLGYHTLRRRLQLALVPDGG